LLKKSIVLCIALALILTGCGEVKQPAAKNSKRTTASTNKNIKKTSVNKKTTETQKLVSEPKPFTPLVLSDTSSLSTKPISWSWLYSSRDSAALLSKYKGYGFGDTSKKVIYLTFDEGYENGYTASILDTLKKNNVHAAFFVTEPYVTGSFKGVPDSELLKRMKSEGHIIGNHSVHHKSMPKFTNEAQFDAELTGVEKAVDSIPGCKMSKYFRPPEGTFSELSLYYAQKLGYKSVFFALAHEDYDPDKQPAPEASKAMLLKNTRDGMVCLLHALSKTNADILDSLIKEWKNRGYEFKTLDDLPN